MVSTRRGIGSMGCLVVLLVLAATAYFGLPIGEAYVRYYRYEDEMQQAARFANINSDAIIRRRLQATADSLGLPPEAAIVAIDRARDRIVISSQYVEEFALPGTIRLHTFTPQAEGTW